MQNTRTRWVRERAKPFFPQTNPAVEADGWMHKNPLSQYQKSVLSIFFVVVLFIASACLREYGTAALPGIAVVAAFFALCVFLEGTIGTTQVNVCPRCYKVMVYNPRQVHCQACSYTTREHTQSVDAEEEVAL